MFSSTYVTNVPSSSDYTIVIPFNEEDNKFSRISYSASLTGGRASSEEVNEVLTLLDTIANNVPTPFQFYKADDQISCLTSYDLGTR